MYLNTALQVIIYWYCQCPRRDLAEEWTMCR